MRKHLLVLILKIIIALITMLVLIKTVNFREIDSAFRNPQNPIFILFALLLLLPNLFLQWYRWHYLLCMVQSNFRIIESLSSYFGGMIVGFVTPGRIGEMGRSLFLTSGDRLQALGLIFLDKLYSFLTIFLGGIWGIILLLTYLFNYAAFIFWPLFTAGIVITLVCFFIALHPQWIRTFFYNLSIMLPYRDKMKRFISCMDLFKREQARILLILSFFLYAVYIIQFCLLAFAFQPIPLTTALTATTSTIFAKTLLPISLADLGIREGASVYFFLKFNVAKVTAFNSAILMFSINILIPTIIGLFFLPRLSWRETKDSSSY